MRMPLTVSTPNHELGICSVGLRYGDVAKLFPVRLLDVQE